MCKIKVLSAVMKYTSLISVGIWWKQHQNIHFNIEIIFVLVKLHQKPYPLCFYIHPLRKLPVWSYIQFLSFKVFIPFWYFRGIYQTFFYAVAFKLYDLRQSGFIKRDEVYINHVAFVLFLSPSFFFLYHKLMLHLKQIKFIWKVKGDGIGSARRIRVASSWRRSWIDH